MKRSILLGLGMLWVLLALSACVDDTLAPNKHDETPTADSYLQLTVNVSSTSSNMLTRSIPTGGEPGDGKEPGQPYETKIDDLMLLFYQGSNGINSPASTPIDKILYLDRDAMNGDNRTEPVPVGLSGGWYDLIVLANTGNLRDKLQGLTLGGVRDYLQQQAWTEHDGVYSRFVMASDGHLDERVYICGENTKENPATATVEVERHAARIDYQTIGNYYDVTEGTFKGSRVNVVGAIIVNKLNAGSYMLKRVVAAAADKSFAADDQLTYLGLEFPETGGPATNYVLDPWSRIKTNENAREVVFDPMLTGTGGGKLASSLYENYFTGYGTSIDSWHFAPGMGEPVGDWYRIGYTLENTVERSAQTSVYVTGVIFKALFTPHKLRSYDAKAHLLKTEEGKVNQPVTFFEFDGDVYDSVEAAVVAFYGGSADVLNHTFDAATWEAVKLYANGLKENDPVGYRRYLLGQTVNKTLSDPLTATEAASLTWQSYMQERMGYVHAQLLNQNGKDTRRLLARYGLHAYVGGVCYYPYWIRHANDDDDTTKGIMEYAIVRNNVYKLRILGIGGLGRDIPYEPDFDPSSPDDPTPPGPGPDDPPGPGPDPDDPTPPGPDDPDPVVPTPTNPLINIVVTVKPWGSLPEETIYF